MMNESERIKEFQVKERTPFARDYTTGYNPRNDDTDFGDRTRAFIFTENPFVLAAMEARAVKEDAIDYDFDVSTAINEGSYSIDEQDYLAEAQSQDEFKERQQWLNRLRENRQIAGEMGLIEGLAVGLLTAPLDPLNYVPIAAGAGTAIRVGARVTAGRLTAASILPVATAREVALQGLTPDRTATEGVLNIGLETLFAGFIGAGGAQLVRTFGGNQKQAGEAIIEAVNNTAETTAGRALPDSQGVITLKAENATPEAKDGSIKLFAEQDKLLPLTIKGDEVDLLNADGSLKSVIELEPKLKEFGITYAEVQELHKEIVAGFAKQSKADYPKHKKRKPKKQGRSCKRKCRHTGGKYGTAKAMMKYSQC